MNLIIDVGNTNIKLAVFCDGKLQTLVRATNATMLVSVRKLLLKYGYFNNCIVSIVGYITPENLAYITATLSPLFLDTSTTLPFQNKYATPNTLGADRVALAAAAAAQYPNTNTLVVDAGTCITYDIVTHNSHYIGGAISPGIQLRYNTLHNLTENLPLLKPVRPSFLIGTNTETSIHVGVINGVVNEIDGFINNYALKYPKLTIILTGGDAKFLSDQLKNTIFANPNFLLQGLDAILEFNTQ